MDISDINKVASRKRMNTDAEKLREKVSRETAKVIKLKVAQDTAYWDLKEKLQQLEANHERLQQNMVEVQMQHEATSGQHQQELRLRPDTLNKLSGTRSICDVLEEYGERLRRSVARCRADQQALGAAYGACGARVRRLAADGAHANAAARAGREAARLHAAQLGEARAQHDALDAARRDMAERLDSCCADLRRREEAVAALQEEAARRAREADAQVAELRRALAAIEAEVRSERERGEAARVALDASSAREANLRRELGEAREYGAAQAARLERCDAERTKAISAIDRLKLDMAAMSDDKKKMELVIDERNQRVKTVEEEMSRLKDNAAHIEAARLELSAQLSDAAQQLQQQARAQHDTEQQLQQHARALHDAELSLAQARAERMADEKRISELVAESAERSRELDVKAGTISRLMADLKAEAEARARAEAALGQARRTHEAERECAAAASARLETALQAKDTELGKQMTIILDIRKEKERLQDKIGGMQATIDNIQKELTGRAPPPPAPAPAPTRDPDMLYGFLSDGSVDGDGLDAREVGRRFESLARGDLPLHALRPPAAHGTVSLSQVKKHLKMKSRTFFKNKRLESKAKKIEE